MGSQHKALCFAVTEEGCRGPLPRCHGERDGGRACFLACGWEPLNYTGFLTLEKELHGAWGGRDTGRVRSPGVGLWGAGNKREVSVWVTECRGQGRWR